MVAGMDGIHGGRVQRLHGVKNLPQLFIGIRVLLPVAGHVIKFILGIIAVSIVGIMGISILGMVDSIFDFRKVKSCELI